MRKHAIMKKGTLLRLLSLLGFSGIAASCHIGEQYALGEYGTPYARFTFKGKVVRASDRLPLEGIRIVVNSTDTPELNDTTYTDRDGRYLMEADCIFPDVERVELQAADTENGAFRELRKSFRIDDADYENDGKGGSWYHGHVTRNVDFEMEERSAETGGEREAVRED